MTMLSGLTVATYNVYLGAQVELLFSAGSSSELEETADVVRRQLAATDFPDRAGALARVLARERPDVVGLQEVTRWTTAPLDDPTQAEVVADFLPALLDALVEQGCRYDAHAVGQSFGGGLPVADEWTGIAGTDVILVRRDGAFTVSAERTASYARFLDVVTPLEGVSFPIRRGYGLVQGEVDGRRVLVANTHLEAYDAEVRDAQRDELLAALADAEGPVAVVGDFNARPDAVGVGPPYSDAWLAAGGDPARGATCGQSADLRNDVSTLDQRIDYVFVRGAEVVSCRVVGDGPDDRSPGAGLWPSDHAGVVARIQF